LSRGTDAYGGYGQLYDAKRTPAPIIEAACWAHARRKFFVLADLEASARRKASGRTPTVVSPMALEAVQRIDALFDIERGINGKAADERRAARQILSAPLVADLHAWMIAERAKLSRGADPAKASRGRQASRLIDAVFTGCLPFILREATLSSALET
jgi:transposase